MGIPALLSIAVCRRPYTMEVIVVRESPNLVLFFVEV